MSMRVYYNGEYRNATVAEEADITAALAETQPVGGVWHLLAEIDCSESSQSVYELTNLGGLTDLLMFENNVMNDTSTASGLTLQINGTDVCGGVLNIGKSGQASYQWASAKWDGKTWNVIKPQITVNYNYLATGNASVPYFYTLDVGAANSMKLYVGNSIYKPTSGTLKVWGR